MAKLKPYTEYNSVQYDYVTQLPVGWQLLPNVAIFQERKERGTENEETLSISAIRGIVKSSDYENIKDRTSDDKSQYLLVKNGDLAYNTMLMWDGAVGHSEFRGIVSPAYTVLKAKIEINPMYFHYQMRTGFYKNYSRRFSYGIVDARLRLYYVYFKRMYSIVPPLETQNRIVNYLNKKNTEIDKFIRNKERLIELLEDKRKNFIKKAVTKGFDCKEFKDSGIYWIGEIPKHWKIKKLRFLCRITTGSKNTEDRIDEGIYPFFVRSQTVERINSYSFDGEAILTAGDGAGVGKVFHYINGRFDYHQRVYNFYNFKSIIGLYLFHYIKTNFHNVALMGDAKSTVDSLRVPLIKEFLVTFPEDKKEQKDIISKIESESSKIDIAISKAQQEIASIKEYREALITDLVTGKRSVPQ